MKRGAIALLALLVLLVWHSETRGMADAAPLSQERIEDEAFMGDLSLKEIILPEGAVSIGARAFAGSGLERIVLPRSLQDIAGDAFAFHPLIRCLPGSNAESWAKGKGFEVEYLEDIQ